MNPDTPDRALLDRYLTGECSAAEAERVRAWLAANAANLTYLNELREIRDVMRSRTTWDVSELWRRTTEAIAADEPDGVFARRDPVAGRIVPGADASTEIEGEPREVARTDRGAMAPQRTRRFVPASVGQPSWLRRWKLAAAVTVLVGAGAVWRATRPDVSAPAGAQLATLREYSTDRGQIAKVRLPDGTAVLLSVASRLRVPTNFDRSRTVYLEGEARFTVPRREGQPFFVQAGSLVTRDLSTEFGVRAYPDEAAARVVVSEGSVAVRDATPSRAPATVLDAGDVLARSADGRVTVERGVDVTPYLGWARHELVFRGVAVRDVLRELSRWYDLDFEIADSALAARKMSATLAANGVTAEVIALLAASSDMRVEYRGRVIVFRAARTQR